MRIAPLLGVALCAAAAGPLSPASAAVTFASTGASFNGSGIVDTQVVDIDGDGHLDIVSGSTTSGGTVTIRLGDGSGGFTTPSGVTAQTADKAAVVTVADADGDGRADLLTAAPGGRTIYIWHRLAGASLAFQTTPTTVTDPNGAAVIHAITVADVTEDGAADLIFAAGDAGARYAAQAGGAYPAVHAVEDSWLPSQDVMVGDMDGDGAREVLSMSYPFPSTWEVVITRFDATGPADIADRSYVYGAGEPHDMLMDDVDGDGRDDLVLALDHDATGDVYVVRNIGTLYWPELWRMLSLGSGTTPTQLVSGDLDGDGITDLAAATSAGPRLLAATRGEWSPFADPTALGTGVSGTQIAVGDLDEDGRPDVVSASATGVDVRLNTSPGEADAAIDASFDATVLGGHTDRTLTVTNTGSTRLLTGMPAITGTDSTLVQVRSSTCNVWIRVGQSCTVGLRYTPTARGALDAVVSFPNAAPAPATVPSVALSGSGALPGLLDGPASAGGGQVAIGTPTVHTITFTNTGDLPVTAPAATIAGSPAWTITADTCAGAVAAGTTCTVSVSVAPAERGDHDATLHVGALSTALHAVGVSAGNLTGPSSLDAGEIAVGGTAARTLTFTNTGDVSVTPPAASIAGSAAWTITDDGCHTAVPAAATCTVAVAVTPGTSGAHAADLHVAGSTTALTATGVVAPAVPGPTAGAPRITGAPRIAVRGALRRGTLLTATATGSGTPTPSIAYRWYRCLGGRCTSAGTGAQYTVVRADAGCRLRVVATATSTAGRATATSALTTRVANPPARPS